MEVYTKMKKIRFSALFLALSLSAVSAFSCNEMPESSQEQSIIMLDPNEPVSEKPNKYSSDSKKTNSAFGQEIEVNNTVFTLNDVVNIGSPANNENDYVYINVTIKNNTDIEYEINSLNNFFVALPDQTEILSNVRTKLYAINNYPKCVDDPITIPANGEFSGYLAGGFVVPSGTDSLTVGFFPTLDNDIDRANVILSPVTPENLSHDDSVLK